MKKIVFIIIAVLILIYVSIEKKEEVKIPNSAIRFRILANSNSPRDQKLKEDIKEKMQKELYMVLHNSRNITEGKLLKVETVKDLQSKNLNLVTLTSQDIENVIKDINIEVEKIASNTIKFKNTLDTNKLIKVLSKYNIEKLLIEEPTLEDIFLHYYK